MKKITSFILALLALFPMFAEEVRIIDLVTMNPTEKNVSTLPEITVKENGDTIDVQISFRYLTIHENDDGYCNISLPGFANNMTPGEPQWLIDNVKYPLIDGYGIDVILKDCKYADIPMKLNYAKMPIPEGLELDHSKIQEPEIIDFGDNFVPENIVCDLDPQYYRGYGFIPTNITPVQYNTTSEVARINYEISYQVVYTPNPRKSNHIDNPAVTRLELGNDDTFFDTFVYSKNNLSGRFNTNQRLNEGGTLLPQPTKYSYLIITTSALKRAANDLAAWKKLLGYETTIKSTTSSWTTENIKNTILSFAQSNPNLNYVLLLGDATSVPGVEYQHIYASDLKFMSDLQYYCLDGDTDYVPDVNGGRIPASTLEEATAAIEKIIYYEQHPVKNTDFYKSAFHAGEYSANSPIDNGVDQTMFIYTCETSAEAMEKNCGFNIERIYAAKPKYNPTSWDNNLIPKDIDMPERLKKPAFDWNKNYENVFDKINEGIVYGIYRGHSNYTQWGSEIKVTSTNIVSDLHNKNLYPVIFSMSCKTGAFNKNERCIVKAFTMGKDYGACGAVMPTEICYSEFNDCLIGALLRAIWPESGISIYSKNMGSKDQMAKIFEDLYKNEKAEYHLGKVLNIGLNAMTEISKNYRPYRESYELITRRLYHCFGDPSMQINTAYPTLARNLVTITPESDGFTVKGDNAKFPSGATICVVDTFRNTLLVYETLQDKKYTVSYPKRCKICISGHNVEPLIVKGGDGHTPGWSRNSKALNHNYNFVDVWTGEKKIKEIDEEKDAYTLEMKENGIIEVSLPGIEVLYEEDCPGKELWTIVGGRWFYYQACDEPTLPWIELNRLDMEPYPEYYDFKLLDSEYVDFPDIDCMWPCFIPDAIGVDPVFHPYLPYTGFYPENIFRSEHYQLNDEKTNRPYGSFVYLRFDPVQYDSENMVMRVHRKIRVQRILPETGVESISASEDPVSYFTIDGLPVDNPQKGKLYIRCKGTEFSKIIF